MLWRRNSARVAQCVTIGVVLPVVRISGTVIVRRVRGKMDKFVIVQRKRKRNSSRERDFCKRDRNDTSSCSESASQVFSSENDIGVPLTDADRWKVLFNCWYPPSVFSFPYVTVGAQNRSFQKQWLNEIAWLAYSNIYNGVFCKRCVVFAPQTVSRSAKPPGSLVSGPHCNYEKAKEHYNNHQNCHYHKLCAAMFDNFVRTDADISRDVRNALNAVDRRLSKKIEIVFPISSELLNFAVAKKYHWGVTETLVHFYWTKLIAMTEFLKLP